MSTRIACSVCGASNPEFAPQCAACAAYMPTVSAGSSADPSEAVPHDSLVGQEVGPYRVEHVLGAGAAGVVYKATDSRLLRPVALKVLSEKLAPSDRARGRMLREARAAARLKSRHVVQVIEHGVWEGRPYIAMEYLEGRTLRARLDERGRLAPEETILWISQIAQGLDKAHAAGIVHRDLKPENVLLAREEEGDVAKILDFGVAKAVEAWADVAATHAGTLLGTPAYMSPEQANGARSLDHRSDLWSLGVIAFECLTGRRPFDREQLGALCVQILSAPLPVPSAVAPDVPPGFDAWWLRAASRDPAARFATALELADALADALLAGATAPASDVSATVPEGDTLVPASRAATAALASAPASRKRYPVLAAGAAILALGVVSVTSLSRCASPALPPTSSRAGEGSTAAFSASAVVRTEEAPPAQTPGLPLPSAASADTDVAPDRPAISAPPRAPAAPPIPRASAIQRPASEKAAAAAETASTAPPAGPAAAETGASAAQDPALLNQRE